MKIAIIGGSGFIGRNLAKELAKSTNEIFIFSRKNTLPSDLQGISNIQLVSSSKPNANQLEGMDIVVNLAGESVIGEKWTEKRKSELRSSRIDFTRDIVNEFVKMKVKPKIFLQGSAIGYYGMHEAANPIFSEDGQAGEDFLAKLCVDWENQALHAKDLGIRTILVRTGIVLSPESGALQQMLLPFKMFVGGPLGTGKQFMSWIHIQDMVKGIIFLINQTSAEGAFNFSAPSPVSNAEFSSILGNVMSRPSLFPVPSLAIKTLYGEGAEVILKGQNVVPTKLLNLGYSFAFPNLKSALENLLS